MKASRRWPASCSPSCSAFPQPGDSFEYEGRRFTVVAMDGLRVDAVKIEDRCSPRPPRGHQPVVQ